MLVEMKYCTKLEYLNISNTRNNPEDRLDELFACLPPQCEAFLDEMEFKER
jgi:hypothetical protein